MARRKATCHPLCTITIVQPYNYRSYKPRGTSSSGEPHATERKTARRGEQKKASHDEKRQEIWPLRTFYLILHKT